MGRAIETTFFFISMAFIFFQVLGSLGIHRYIPSHLVEWGTVPLKGRGRAKTESKPFIPFHHMSMSLRFYEVRQFNMVFIAILAQ